MNRDDAKSQLVTALDELTRCCQPADTFWPARELLEFVEQSVACLVATQRTKPVSPAWKAFQLLNRRMPSLLLVSRVNNLVNRAWQRLEEVGESPLDKLGQQDREDTRRLLHDLERLRVNLRAAKDIHWTELEKPLAELSRTRTVELASKQTPPITARCYTRALELLVIDEFRHKPLKQNAAPLLAWLAKIKHPESKGLLAFNRELANIIEREHAASQQEARLREREKGRQRTRRYREWHRGKQVYPGDWLRFKNATDFARFYGREHPLPKVCAGLEDSPCRSDLSAVLDRLSCGRALVGEPYWYYHRLNHLAHCRDCQEAEWMADGYEVEGGYPTTWFGPSETREQRIAARKRHHQEEMDRYERWRQTPEGQAWLENTNRKFIATLKARAKQEGWTTERLRTEARAYGLI